MQMPGQKPDSIITPHPVPKDEFRLLFPSPSLRPGGGSWGKQEPKGGSNCEGSISFKEASPAQRGHHPPRGGITCAQRRHHPPRGGITTSPGGITCAQEVSPPAQKASPTHRGYHPPRGHHLCRGGITHQEEASPPAQEASPPTQEASPLERRHHLCPGGIITCPGGITRPEEVPQVGRVVGSGLLSIWSRASPDRSTVSWGL